MKRTGFIVLIVVGLATAAATASGHETATPNAARCGGTLWRLKTFSDIGRWRVRLTPEVTTIGDIGKRASPRLVPRLRRTHFQRQAWEVVASGDAVPTREWRPASGALRRRLLSERRHTATELPLLKDTSPTADRSGVEAVRRRVRATDFYLAAPWRDCLLSAGSASGVRNGRSRGQRRNGAELHPVTDIRIVAGC